MFGIGNSIIRGLHSAAMLTRRRSVVSNVSGHALGPILKMRPKACPETFVTNYRFELRNIPEERSSHIHGGGNLKRRNFVISSQF
jgi:hypothetical protein